jgi:heterotetrameric sarcosine oxidase delta subunit
MLLIPCPWCGPRDETEFTCGGQAHVVAPCAPEDLGDAAWSEYLYMRTNPKGPHSERWVHTHGCRRWFNVARDTSTECILAVYAVGALPSQAGDDSV